MADMDALKRDLQQAIGFLPKEVIQSLGDTAQTIAVKYRDHLGAVLPKVMELLKPHVMALGMEHAMGVLDVKELEACVLASIAANGVNINGPHSG